MISYEDRDKMAYQLFNVMAGQGLNVRDAKDVLSSVYLLLGAATLTKIKYDPSRNHIK